MTKLTLFYRDVARLNVTEFDRLGAFHGVTECLYHYYDIVNNNSRSNLHCAIGITSHNPKGENSMVQFDTSMLVHHQWASRPDDERFTSLPALAAFADYRKRKSKHGAQSWQSTEARGLTNQ